TTLSTCPFLRRELQPLTVENIRDHLVDLPVSSKGTSPLAVENIRDHLVDLAVSSKRTSTANG
ncbi:MAG: hypothetical protein SGJ27_29010, partial [Candidatus Melainabacteria bacterium]|nr:hypothetical protein [Candidatus Melainabacteria bacterium]